jgi:hypothetical protein
MAIQLRKLKTKLESHLEKKNVTSWKNPRMTNVVFLTCLSTYNRMKLTLTKSSLDKPENNVKLGQNVFGTRLFVRRRV